MKKLQQRVAHHSSYSQIIIKAICCLTCVLGAMLVVMPAYSQTKAVSGTVVDERGSAVSGATIAIKDKPQGTVSDQNGKFTLNVSPRDVLSVSFIGYIAQEIPVGNQTNIAVVLKEDAQSFEDVVVVGYGTQTKATLTGAVSSVTSDDIVVTKNENVVNMLSGKLPGVRISQKSSQPGEFNSVIDIRGMGTPLIVVDGIPRDQDYFSRMDPNEIESVSVLKDASAAIYGVRSANGVLLITTNRGKSSEAGKVDINYSVNVGWQQFLYVPNNVNATDYMTLKNEQVWRNFNNNYMNRRAANFSESDFEYWKDRKSTSWIDAAFDQTSPQQQHNFSVNGSTEKINYFFNAGYMKQIGAYKSKSLNYDRWNFRSNVDAKITKRLTASVNVSGYKDEKNQPRTDIWTIYKQAWRQRPTIPIYANDNPLYPNYDMIDSENPVVITDSDLIGKRTTRVRSFNGQLALNYQIPGIEGLTAKAMYSYDAKFNDYTDLKKAYYLYSYHAPEYGEGGQIVKDEYYQAHLKNSPSSITRQSNINYGNLSQLSLNYKHSFGNHNVAAFLAFEEQYQEWDGFSAYRELAIESEYLFAGEDKNQKASGSTPGDYVSQGFIGKLNYDFNGKYLAEFNFRYDGSSKWPTDSRWGFFPSASIGWRLSEEKFIKDNFSIIDNLKLRASYGKMGDDGSASTYPSTITGYALASNNYQWIFDGTINGGVSPTSIPNYNLTWYTSKMMNFGLDFDLWNGKLGGTFEYFSRDREGLLATRLTSIPGTVGASLPRENLEGDRAFGFELSLSHRNRIGDLQYYVNAQVSQTKMMNLTKMETPAGNSYDKWRNKNDHRYQNIWWGYEKGGIYHNYQEIYNHDVCVTAGDAVPGDYYYKDWNGDGFINSNDNHPIATKGIPLINYGINIGASYKNVDLAMNFQGAAGVYTQYNEVLIEPLAYDGGALEQFMDRWHPADPNADYFDPSTKWISGYYPNTGSPRGSGTAVILDASYIRLKSIEIGYTLPKNWLDKVGISNLRIYFSGYNLLTITGMKNSDPEHPGITGGSSSNYVDMYMYPLNKTYNLGASLKF